MAEYYMNVQECGNYEGRGPLSLGDGDITHILLKCSKMNK
jgi:hypothetical protein